MHEISRIAGVDGDLFDLIDGEGCVIAGQIQRVEYHVYPVVAGMGLERGVGQMVKRAQVFRKPVEIVLAREHLAESFLTFKYRSRAGDAGLGE